MERLITDNSAEITKLCREFHVQRLELFGSAARGVLTPESDVDFLVEFSPLPEGSRADAYFGLLDSLQALLKRSVDLVMVKAVRNRYFLEAIADTRTTLYAA
jgi:predicted nucleotidyltransferase